MNDDLQRSDRFPETRWSLIVRIAGNDPEDRDGALAEICEVYRPPIYGYISSLGYSSHDADDLTQEFFSNFLKRDCFSRPIAERGKLRTYLLTAVKRFLTDEHRKCMRQKRGGGAAFISIDAVVNDGGIHLDELSDDRSPDKLFDLHWAGTLLENVLTQLEDYYRVRGEENVFELLKPFLRSEGGHHTVAELAAILNVSEGTVRVRLHRFRARYRLLLQGEVAVTLEPGADIIAEISYLRSLFT